MRFMQTETTSVGVPERARQAEEIRARWSWVEPSVWTERMLTALEQGVKGGRWFSLIDKVCRKENLRSAFKKVKANKGKPGHDHVTVEMFERRLEENLEGIVRNLQEGTYRPQGIQRVWIPKAGSKEKRPLGMPTVRDRVVQGALRHVLEPIFERDFARHSYGFRPGRGCKDALRRVSDLLAQGYTHVVDVDLKSYYDLIPREGIMAQVEEKVSDGPVLSLLRAYLDQEVFEAGKQWISEQGTPQGAVISPLLSNIYLNPLDHLMERKGYEMTRYADDIVVQCRSKAEAEQARATVQAWIASAKLELNPEKTCIVDTASGSGFDFLGYHFEQGRRWPCEKSMRRFKDAVRVATRRTNGHSFDHVIMDTNRRLRGWFEYFKHSHKSTFPRADRWIRMRLRSILRKRNGGKGRGRGLDNIRWTINYFAGHGLFSLAAAHTLVCQSSRR